MAIQEIVSERQALFVERTHGKAVEAPLDDDAMFDEELFIGENDWIAAPF
ncbi:hypothetical protein [Candidatus Protochlamydia naegleriophila]|nr:hypothetical protein [Candidatus Protochlamydia naegleriophila]